MAITTLANDSRLRQQKTGRLKYIIVDEYQDINFGQQTLVELLASSGADLMVIGDDDQTIYEWRGARSDYILREFQTTFTNKPHRTYKLTHSFRFGYSIAQSSYNVILHNANRLEKPVVSNDPASDSRVTIITDKDETGDYANRRLTEEIILLVKEKEVPPSDIRVLARTYAQLNSFSTELMLKQIPFKVMGRAPFLQSGESRTLLDYVRVAAKLHGDPNDITNGQFINIANKPSRYLARRDIERMLSDGRQSGLALSVLLHDTIQDYRKFSKGIQRDNLEDLASVLEEIHRKLAPEERTLAGPLLEWIEKAVGFRQHYEDYYGRGEASMIRMEAVNTFIAYAHWVELNWKDFIAHVENFDTTLGRPEREWIKMMTIHTAKGLEFDYVIIPDCKEGYLPVIGNNDDPTYDTQQPRRTPKAAEWIENERRLFYVGATRAKKELFIGAPMLVSKRSEIPGKDQNGTLNPSRFREMSHEAPEDRVPLVSRRVTRVSQDTLEHQPVRKNDSGFGQKPSRFLEEMEWEQTQAIADELVRAARGERNRLAAVCRRFFSFHHIVRLVKEEYARMLPHSTQGELAQVELSRAERPFGYTQTYDTPFSRAEPSESQPENGNGAGAGEIWGHIGPGQSRRRNWYDDDDGDAPPF